MSLSLPALDCSGQYGKVKLDGDFETSVTKRRRSAIVISVATCKSRSS